MKKIRISKTAFINCVLFFIFFPVPIIEQANESLDGIIKAIQIIAFLLMAGMVFIKKIRIGKLEILLIVYCLISIILPFSYDVKRISMTMSCTVFPIVSTIFLFYMMRNNIEDSISYIAKCYKVLIWINLICMLVFPQGIVSSSVGASAIRACWLFGSKNNVVYSMPIILLFLTLDAMRRNRNHLFYMTLVAFFIAVFSMGDKGGEIFGGSSTAIIMSLTFILFYICLRKSIIVQKLFSIKLVSICSLILTMFICLIATGGIFSIAIEMLTSMMGKSISFSGRNTVWSQCLYIFMKSPIFGSQDCGQYFLWGGAQFTTNEYSFWLNVMVRTGCMGMLLIFILLFYTEKNKVINRYVYLYRITFLLIMISGMVDVPYWETIALVLLFRMYLENLTSISVNNKHYEYGE